MRRFLAAVAFFSILSTGASLAEGWFMKRVEVPVFCADIIEVRKLLLEMVPGVGLGIDPVRNLLLVHGTDEQIEIIQELLEVGKRTDSTLDITAVQTLGPVETETETGIEIVTVTVIRTAIGIETGIKTETETETTKSAPRVLARRNRRETRAKREKSGLTGRRRARVPEVRKKIRAEKLWCRPSISAAWAAVEMRRRPRLRLAASAPRNPPAEHLFPHPGVAISIGPSSPIRKRLRNG